MPHDATGCTTGCIVQTLVYAETSSCQQGNQREQPSPPVATIRYCYLANDGKPPSQYDNVRMPWNGFCGFHSLAPIMWKLSSTKPEVHNILHYRRRRTEPRPQVTRAKNFVKFARVVFWDIRQTDRQTQRYRQDDSNTSHPSWGRSNNDASSVRSDDVGDVIICADDRQRLDTDQIIEFISLDGILYLCLSVRQQRTVRTHWLICTKLGLVLSCLIISKPPGMEYHADGI